MGFSWSDLNPFDPDNWSAGGPRAPKTMQVPAGKNPDGSIKYGTVERNNGLRGSYDSAADLTGLPTSDQIVHAVNKPYEDKRAGYDAIQAKVLELQAKREQQKKYAYDLANQAFEPSRKAMAAVYGDPSTWKL